MINKTVLVVDDESDVNLTLKMVLEENGFKVDSFTDPLLALENIKRESEMYDLIILDVRMPDMSGFELYKEIKKIDDKVKICFLTAGEMDYEQFGKELFPALDENCFIQKPISYDHNLLKLLGKIL